MRGFKKRRWPRLSKRQTREAIEAAARQNPSDPFTARRVASRIKHGLFEFVDGVVHVFE